MKNPVCRKCKHMYKKKDMVSSLGGYSNIRGTGMLIFKCSCGNVMRMHYIEPTKKTGFFIVIEDK